MNIQAFQKLKPCIAPGAHKFTTTYPPAGQFGYAMVCCERCGMTRDEAKQ